MRMDGEHDAGARLAVQFLSRRRRWGRRRYPQRDSRPRGEALPARAPRRAAATRSSTHPAKGSTTTYTTPTPLPARRFVRCSAAVGRFSDEFIRSTALRFVLRADLVARASPLRMNTTVAGCSVRPGPVSLSLEVDILLSGFRAASPLNRPYSPPDPFETSPPLRDHCPPGFTHSERRSSWQSSCRSVAPGLTADAYDAVTAKVMEGDQLPGRVPASHGPPSRKDGASSLCGTRPRLSTSSARNS